MNRKHNSSNPNQGDAKKVLCVCSAGLLRSPTIAVILSAEPYNYNTRAVGHEVSCALIPLDDVLVGWADEIVCANTDALEAVVPVVKGGQIVINLGIPDCYCYMDPDLVEEIKRTYNALDQI